MLCAFSAEADTDFLPSVMRMILRKSNAQSLMGFGEGIAKHHSGYDGEYALDSRPSQSQLPIGEVCVELFSGAKTPASKKFTDDFNKRQADTSRTFFAVSLMEWSGQSEWQRKKKCQAKFKDVVAWSATQLADEINLHPEVTVYALHRMGRLDIRFMTAEVWANRILDRYSTVPPDVIALGGYDSEVREIIEFLASPSQGRRKALAAESRQHAELALAKIIVNNCADLSAINLLFTFESDWPFHIGNFQDTKVITDAPLDSSFVESATFNRVDVLTVSEETSRNKIHLKRRRLGVLEKEFKDASIPDYHEVARRVHSGITFALKTMYGLEPPPRKWLKVSAPIAGFTLVGALSPGFDTDLKIAMDLFGDWRQLEEHLNDCVTKDNPLIEKVGGAYRIRNGLDALETISQNITDSVLLEFEKHFELLMRQQNAKSSLLNRGVSNPGPSARLLTYSCRMVAQLANCNLEINTGGRIGVKDFAKKLVKCALIHSNEKWYRRRIACYLPVLIQVSPDEVLEWIEQTCESDPNFYLGEVGETGPFGEWQPYVYILWALEKAAWHPEYVSKSVRILAKLARIPTPQQIGNTAFKSLLGVFRPWVPCTVIPVLDRFKLIDAAWGDAPEIWAELCRALLPTDEVGSFNEEPEFWAIGRANIEPPPFDEVRAAWLGFFERYFPTIKGDPLALLQFLMEVGVRVLDSDLNGQIIESLITTEWTELSESDMLEAMKKLEEVRSFATYFDEPLASITDEQLLELQKLSETLGKSYQPLDKRKLFDSSTPSRRFTRDWQTAKAQLENEQEAAATELLNGDDADLLAFALEVEESGKFMACVGKVCPPERIQGVVDLILQCDDPRRESMLYALLYGRRLLIENPGLVTLGSNPPVWAEVVRIALVPDLEDRIAALENADLEIKQYFWLTWGRSLIIETTEERLQWTLEQFLQYGNPFDAIKTITFHIPRVHDHAIASNFIQVIEAGVEYAKAGNPWPNGSFSLVEIIDYCLIDPNPDEINRLANLELQLNRVLSYGYDYPALSRALSADPKALVELSSLLYRNDDGVSTNGGKYTNLYSVLTSLRVLPGQSEDGLDEEKFLAWARDARAIASEKRYTKAFGIVFGQWVGRCTVRDPDGYWPHRAVRAVIEEFNDETFGESLRVGYLNSKGVSVINRFDPGGAQKKEADEMLNAATAISFEHPKAAAILRQIAGQLLSSAADWERRIDEDD